MHTLETKRDLYAEIVNEKKGVALNFVLSQLLSRSWRNHHTLCLERSIEYSGKLRGYNNLLDMENWTGAVSKEVDTICSVSFHPLTSISFMRSTRNTSDK